MQGRPEILDPHELKAYLSRKSKMESIVRAGNFTYNRTGDVIAVVKPKVEKFPIQFQTIQCGE